MNQQEEIRKIAIKRHDLDAPFFQTEYEKAQDKYADEFLYGRYHINEELENIIGTLPKEAKILDIGCGTGHLSHYLQKKGFNVIGIEPSQNMLSYARKNFPQIQFIEGVSSELPFEDNTFDFILSIEVMRYLHSADIAKTYSEVFRVLKKGGLFFSTHVNRWSTDFYFPFYYLKGLIKKLNGGMYQNCYFTTTRMEVKKLKKKGFSEVLGIGKMFGSIRVAYKFGKLVGKSWARFLEIFSQRQRFQSSFLKNFSGHLFIIARK
ncbi:MAG TPA: class I SAM-dependent methyltransferase [Chitinophagaceae bacterium]|jgi:ubiquinone/menaquinone biosynthesis C-methylase UbiE|nr:class I SAM-dependent methyltransferase [Chitinophagaceae bacterium]